MKVQINKQLLLESMPTWGAISAPRMAAGHSQSLQDQFDASVKRGTPGVPTIYDSIAKVKADHAKMHQHALDQVHDRAVHPENYINPLGYHY